MSAAFMWMVALMARSSVLLLLALLLDQVLKKAPAQTRHAMWTATFVALLALPVLSAVLPALPVPGLPAFGLIEDLPEVARPDAEEPGLIVGEGAGVGHGSAFQSAGLSGKQNPPGEGFEELLSPKTGDRRLDASYLDYRAWSDRAIEAVVTSAREVVLAAWATGVLAALVLVVLSFRRAAQLIARAGDLLDVAWRTDLRNTRALLGMRESVRLRTSTRVGTPMAGGLLRGAVLVPELARRWSAERRRFVLLHELVHVLHRDPVRHLVARLALAMHWPNPLAWLAAHRAMSAREEACDETVLSMGAKPSRYARELLHLHDALQPANTAAIAALPIVQRSLMEKRLMNILRKDRRPLRRRTAVALAAFASVTTLSVAAAVPQEPDKVKIKVEPKVEVQDKVRIKVEPVVTVKTEPRVAVNVVAEPKVQVKVEPRAVVKVEPDVRVNVQSEPRVVVQRRPVVRDQLEIQPAPEPTAVPAPRADVATGIGAVTVSPAPQASATVAPRVPATTAVAPTSTLAPTAVGIGTPPVPQVDALAPAVAPSATGISGVAVAPVPTAQWSNSQDACKSDAAAGSTRHSWSSTYRDDGELICRRAYGEVELDERTGRVVDMTDDAIVVYETRNDAGRRWLEVRPGNQYTWKVDGEERPFDEAGEEWLEALQEVMSGRWQISRIRGEVATKRGEIATIHGRAATLRGQQATARGQVASMRGQIATIHGRQSTAQGQVATARGHVAALRGQMATQRSVVSALSRQRRDATADELVHIDALMESAERRMEEMQARLTELQRAAEREQERVEAQQSDVEEEVEAVQEQIEAYELEERLARIEREIEMLEVQEHVERIEAEIAALRVDEVVAQIERELAPALERLERASARVR